MVSSTLLTLIVIPAVFGLVKGWSLSRKAVDFDGSRSVDRGA
jgi:copper/silver efflux system protein